MNFTEAFCGITVWTVIRFIMPQYVKNAEGIPRCEKCGGMIKPDVVLYEEGLDPATISGAVRAISEADMLIIGGTSLVVYPAAGFIDYFHGKYLVLINKSETAWDVRAIWRSQRRSEV